MPTAVVAHPGAELYGSDRMVLETVDGMVDDGWSVLVVLPSHGPLAEHFLASGARLAHATVPVLRRGALTPAGILRLAAASVRAVPPALRLLRRERPDVLYVSTLTQPVWLLVGRLAGVHVVCHVHEAEGSASKALRRALAAPLLLAHRVLINSGFARAVLAGAVPRLLGRTVVVPNGVAGPPRTLRPVAVRRTGGPLRVLYVGRLSERKGVDVLVDAVAHLVQEGLDVRLRLVGAVFPGNEAFERKLRDKAAHDLLVDRVEFAGFVHDVWAEAEDAHVWVVPSRVDEPFGNTAVEAVLAGRPLVAARTGGLVEAAGGYGSVVFADPGDVGALARALREVDERWDELTRATVEDRPAAEARNSPHGYRRAVLDNLGQT